MTIGLGVRCGGPYREEDRIIDTDAADPFTGFLRCGTVWRPVWWACEHPERPPDSDCGLHTLRIHDEDGVAVGRPCRPCRIAAEAIMAGDDLWFQMAARQVLEIGRILEAESR